MEFFDEVFERRMGSSRWKLKVRDLDDVRRRLGGEKKMRRERWELMGMGMRRKKKRLGVVGRGL